MADTDEIDFYEKVTNPEPEEAVAPDKLADALKALVTEFDRDGAEERVWLLAEVQRCLLYWHGESSLTWHEATHSWLSIWDAYDLGLVDEEDVEDYDRDVNIYRPLLESIIAASSIEVPRIFFTPKKASSATDIVTSREATKISTHLDAVNDSKELIQRAYFILANQHFAAGYTYFEKDAKKYGVEQVPQMGPVQKTRPTELCPECSMDISEELPADAEGMYKFCPSCQEFVDPQSDEETYEEEDITGYEEVPNSKVCIEVYGPQNVKIPHYAAEFKGCPYLILDIEEPVSWLADIYPEMAEQILNEGSQQSDKYDRWARESTNTMGGDRKSRATWRRIFVRNWGLNSIGNPEERKEARKQFPDGCVIHMVNELFIKAMPIDMDAHWEITVPSLSETLHDDPAGKAIIPISESQNDLLQLWMENIKHNIPEVYVDSNLFDLEKYREIQARPGMRTPVKRPPGQTISNAIHETRAVSIPRESIELYKIFESLGQFCSSALPSIFGGYMQGGSETAFEYDASRQAALQRVALRMSVVNTWWARLKKKAVELYNANMDTEQEYPQRAGTGFMPVKIDPANLKGELRGAVPEASSSFPTTWAQKREFVIQGLQSNNPQIVGLYFHPENSTFLKEVIGIPELFVPGEADRMKQLWEISQMLNAEAMPGGPEGQMISSVPPDPRLDNGPAHIITCQTWLNSDDGREAQVNNPLGFENVLAHLTEHIFLELQKGAPPAGPAGPEGEPADVPPPTEGAM